MQHAVCYFGERCAILDSHGVLCARLAHHSQAVLDQAYAKLSHSKEMKTNLGRVQENWKVDPQET